MHTGTISGKLRELPALHRTFLKTFISLALGMLVAGAAFGLLTALIRTGYVAAEPATGYRLMTGHGVTVFFFWLYFAQTALLLALGASQCAGKPRIAFVSGAWTGLALMLSGFAASLAGTYWGTPLLYDGSPDIVGEDKWQAALFYAGYVLLAVGLIFLAVSIVATALAAKSDDKSRAWSTLSFAVACWAGLIIVSSIATLNTFLPAALWAVRLAELPVSHETGWHLLFHNLHYLPLMGTVIVWYALVQDIVGVRSIFGKRFSKIIFTLYLVFVPPTSLYHMFLDPNLSPFLRGLGSLLSLFISVPTIAVFLVIVISLEAHARAGGAKGLFGWVKSLPWQEPAISAMGWSVLNLAVGGIFAFVLIQEKLAPVLSDTFFVPAYFHFLTIGTISLTLIGALAWVLPPLFGRQIVAPGLLAKLPIVLSAGLLAFGGGGMAAGLSGMPRRVIDASYDGAAPRIWAGMSPLIASGAVLMIGALGAYIGVLAISALWGPAGRVVAMEAKVLPNDTDVLLRQRVWTAPLAVAVLVAGMYIATLAAFALVRSLPIAAVAAGH